MKKSLLLLLAVSLSVSACVAPGYYYATPTVVAADHPYYTHGAYYYSRGVPYRWHGGHYGYYGGHRVWVHGYYAGY